MTRATRCLGRALVLAALLCVCAPARAATAPKSVDFTSLYEAANTLYKAGEYATALEVYGKAYAVAPRPEAQYGIARCLHQLGRHGDASAAYEKFLADAPKHEGAPKARAYLVATLLGDGHVKLGAGDFTAATAVFERALAAHAAADPALVEVSIASLHVALAEALVGIGRDADALGHARLALSPPPTPDVRARAEGLVRKLGTPPPPESASGTSAATAPAAGSGGASLDPAAVPPKTRRTAWPAILAGAGAGAIVVAAVVAGIVVAGTRVLVTGGFDGLRVDLGAGP